MLAWGWFSEREVLAASTEEQSSVMAPPWSRSLPLSVTLSVACCDETWLEKYGYFVHNYWLYVNIKGWDNYDYLLYTSKLDNCIIPFTNKHDAFACSTSKIFLLLFVTSQLLPWFQPTSTGIQGHWMHSRIGRGQNEGHIPTISLSLSLFCSVSSFHDITSSVKFGEEVPPPTSGTYMYDCIYYIMGVRSKWNFLVSSFTNTD